MWLLGLIITLFSIIKTRALECVSVINQKCMPRAKILDVNEGVGEALFYPYNVLINKCSGSRNTFDNSMAKLCVPNVIKRVNMQVYNSLMRLNETRNVLWHESCKYVCKSNSSICNNKQIWNDDTCKCDCNEDLTGIVNCTKGYTWNPSTCECQYDTWCKPGQYLDHKNCVSQNKLVGRITEECTSIINETMMNNDNYDNVNNYYNVITYVFIGLFLIVLVICFCVFAYFKWFKGKYTNIKYILIIINMSIESLKIKNQSYYYWNDIVYIDDFDINYLKINKRESRVGINIYYIGYVLYKLEYITNSVVPLYLNVKSLLGSVEKINGSSDRYLVINKSNIEVINVFNTIKEYVQSTIIKDNSIKIDGFDKIRFNSDVHLPLGKLIEFKVLAIIIKCIIKKNDKYYPEIYLDKCLYRKV